MNQLSKFTYFCNDGDRVLLINTLNKKLMFSDERETVNCIFQNITRADEIKSDNKTFQALKANGFILDDNSSEELIAKKRYWNEVYDNRLGLTIMPTEQCNCKCPYCYEDFSRPKMNEQTLENLLSFLRKNLIRYNGLNISWFGGEPLLALDIIEKVSQNAISMCHAHRIMYDSSITTNGVLLTEDVLNRLISCRISRFQITLDGTKNTHDQTRVLRNGKGTFDTIINNLLNIKKCKRLTIRVNIRINITKESLNGLPELVDFLYETFGEDKRFSFYFRPIGDWNHNIEDDDLKKNLIPSLDKVYKVLLEHPRKLNCGILYEMLVRSMCFAVKKNHFVLGSDGTVYKCTVYFNEEMNKVGKLLSNGRICWDEEKLARWMNNDFNDSKCNTCFLFATCHGRGCPAKEIIHDKKIGCGHEFEHISSILKLLYQSNDIHHFYKNLEE